VTDGTSALVLFHVAFTLAAHYLTPAHVAVCWFQLTLGEQTRLRSVPGDGGSLRASSSGAFAGWPRQRPAVLPREGMGQPRHEPVQSSQLERALLPAGLVFCPHGDLNWLVGGCGWAEGADPPGTQRDGVARSCGVW